MPEPDDTQPIEGDEGLDDVNENDELNVDELPEGADDDDREDDGQDPDTVEPGTAEPDDPFAEGAH
jgi:hypothetical protein